MAQSSNQVKLSFTPTFTGLYFIESSKFTKTRFAIDVPDSGSVLNSTYHNSFASVINRDGQNVFPANTEILISFDLSTASGTYINPRNCDFSLSYYELNGARYSDLSLKSPNELSTQIKEAGVATFKLNPVCNGQLVPLYCDNGCQAIIEPDSAIAFPLSEYRIPLV